MLKDLHVYLFCVTKYVQSGPYLDPCNTQKSLNAWAHEVFMFHSNKNVSESRNELNFVTQLLCVYDPLIQLLKNLYNFCVCVFSFFFKNKYFSYVMD